MATALGGGLEMFAPAFDPFHRFAELARQEADQQLLGVNIGLAAEPAAHFGSDDTHLVFGDAQHGGGNGSEQVGNLGGGIKGQRSFGTLVISDGAARFHGVGDNTRLEHALFDDDFRLGEGLVDLAIFLFVNEGDVIGPLGMNGGRAGFEGLLRIGNSGEGRVVDFDTIGGVASQIGIGRDHDGHGMSGKIGAALGEDGVIGDAETREADAARNVADTIEIGAGEHGDDAGESKRGGGVNAVDPGGGIRAADDRREMHVGQFDVVEVCRGAGDHARIFLALDPLADVCGSFGGYRTHGVISSQWPRRRGRHLQCADSRCSGKDCLPGHVESLRRWGRDCARLTVAMP